METSSDIKIFLGIIVATVVIIVGGAVVLSKQQTQQQLQVTKIYSESELVASDSWVQGNKEAKVAVVEFSDFQCPACASVHPVVKKIMADFGDKVKLIYRHYPLPNHKFAQKAALAAEAAGEQGKFWEYHDKLFENQTSWSSESDPSKTFIQYAKDIGLNIDQFTRSFEEKKGQNHINSDTAAGNKVGIAATPTFFINGTKFEGGLTFNQFKAEIEKRL